MIKPPLVTFCSILGLFTVAPTFAGSTGAPRSVQGAAEREIVRRQADMDRALAAMQEGDVARKAKDLEVAVQKYRYAVDLLPESESTRAVRSKALALFGSASVRLAEQRIAEGRYADAETIAKIVLQDEYNPGYRPAIELLANLEKPDYYNKVITPRHHKNVEQVKKLLIEAKGFYEIGDYDKAMQRYDQVLNIDRYNSSARKGQEEVNRARSEYATDARNMTRSQLLYQVDKGWELQPKKYGTGPTGGWERDALPSDGSAAITAKLNRIIIPSIQFRDATLPEAIDFLKKKSRELDINEPDPARRGVNIVLQTEIPGGGFGGGAAPAAPAEAGIPGLDPIPADPTIPAPAPFNPSERRITLSLTNVPLAEVLRYITQLADMKVKIDPYAVAIVPLTMINDLLLNREFKVPPGFLNSAPGGAAPSAPSPTAAASGGIGIPGRVGAKEFFASHGVQFGPGASATFVASNSTLLVRNTQEQLDLIETIVEAGKAAVPSQVEIEAKFVEISQNNLKELGFDWLLGQFNIPSSNRVFGSGGTSGNGNVIENNDFPFVDPYGNVVGGNPLTSGNRTGNGAISANAIDALLFPTGGLTSAAPGVFGLAGVFTDPQFQLVIRAINQKKGVDLLSSPRITTKSGNRAKIEIIREFRFPTEFTPPQIPQTVGATGGTGGIGGSGVTSVPVTPTTPTSFETRNTGVTLDVEPVVGPDNSTIDLNLQPEVVEFEGFINYGSPILAPASSSWVGDILRVSPPSVITPNVINQPIFSTRRVTTSVSVWDGQTVALGGLMREDVQKVEDKVPLLGDIPVVGRLFRSSVDQHLKRNLVIFVTARLINPAGEPLNQEVEEEEEIESMVPEQLMDQPMPLFSK